jgi:hypothetical protein
VVAVERGDGASGGVMVTVETGRLAITATAISAAMAAKQIATARMSSHGMLVPLRCPTDCVRAASIRLAWSWGRSVGRCRSGCSQFAIVSRPRPAPLRAIPHRDLAGATALGPERLLALGTRLRRQRRLWRQATALFHSFNTSDLFDAMIAIDTLNTAVGAKWTRLQNLLRKFRIDISNPLRTAYFTIVRIQCDGMLEANNNSSAVWTFNISLGIC